MNDSVPAERDYRATVFLPRTAFPMRGDLPKREPEALARWEAMGLFARLRADAAGRTPFILHDGPPYANGNLHIGHALNKIHKDVINRARQMAGFDADYVPGWDCHGLPIEWMVEQQYRKAGKNKDEVPVLDFRAECRAYAAKWLDIQAAEFKRLGIEGNWAQRYATMDFPSEAAIAAEIHKFAANGALYRGLRPVMWSPVEKTALAEAEVEYQDRTDTAIWVRFRVVNKEILQPIFKYDGLNSGSTISVVIWTTTPWTIPGNRAVAFKPSAVYSLLQKISGNDPATEPEQEYYIVSNDLVQIFSQNLGIRLRRLATTYGRYLSNLRVLHPLSKFSGYDFDVPMLPGTFVTTDAGTGFVHMAPAHGEDDFIVCTENGIEVPETVNDDGTYAADVPLFAGQHVYKVADNVCRALDDNNTLLKREEFRHSYPHSWRSKAPLIYLARPNWFIRMDGPEHIREKALEAIDATRFVPDAGRNRIRSMVESRPDWCISRQRAWGVPIAIFMRKADKSILNDPAVFARTRALFEAEGADAWYARPAADFLGNAYNPDDYEQVFDIVDVWFESGSTHAFVLEARGMPWPADLYLEGSDQHRGWFQASLLEAVGTRGVAPFKAIVTDGFVLDEQGRKMSKSLGNVTAPQEVIDLYGADILRLWVMNSDVHNDLRIGKEILKQQADLYRRIRNTLRWILGGLEGYSDAEILDRAAMPELEQYMLHKLAELEAMLRRAVETHDWTGVYPAIHQFCNNDLSAFYFDIRKDALYCDVKLDAEGRQLAQSDTRRACRTVLDILHRCLTTWLAPVLPFTADEAWRARFGEDECVHLAQFPPVPATWRDDALDAGWAEIRAVRKLANTQLEEARRSGDIASSLQACISITLAVDAPIALQSVDWAELLITSAAETMIATDEAGAGAAAPLRAPPKVTIAPGTKCARCWQVLPEVGEDQAHPTLCRRCCEYVG
ncbi:MAG: isoleucine--tRNA ligase [Acidiphilium sp. 37-64-53]|uniref:isoleucine--tRNA ligase n=1 Tax=Acidiphilium TaxID=522 RepID=UPI000BC9DE38|nr:MULTISPECIES: isoleucine--tRNA ligase [Acidiphilium]OYW03101.1 MAG: isoleucine--tRNA ligase [Acidiphilium sp. 37-64-53]OZB30802.1 MAG: isoleucine--tRNA ligase [Acidiphilium sp. 34-64-41]HQT85159.1 isoleucine--tRNA ligase [Acidiphilium rubrum]